MFAVRCRPLRRPITTPGGSPGSPRRWLAIRLFVIIATLLLVAWVIFASLICERRYVDLSSGQIRSDRLVAAWLLDRTYSESRFSVIVRQVSSVSRQSKWELASNMCWRSERNPRLFGGAVQAFFDDVAIAVDYITSDQQTILGITNTAIDLVEHRQVGIVRIGDTSVTITTEDGTIVWSSLRRNQK